jgi:predicted dehydrogenase
MMKSMKIGVLGTGPVAKSVAARLAELGHAVLVGTRDPAATLARTAPDTFGNPPRGTEIMLPIWARVYVSTSNPMFSVKLVR